MSDMDAESARSTLKQWALDHKLAQAHLSDDGLLLQLDDNNQTLPGSLLLTIETTTDKSCQYSLASIFLQILEPDQGLLAYRSACKKHNVADPVTALDKPAVVGYFLGDANKQAAPAAASATASAPAAADSVVDAATRDERKRKHDERQHRKDKERKQKDKHRSSHRDDKTHKKKKKEAKSVSDEQLLMNLTAVAGRRQEDDHKAQAEIAKALSADGFEVTPEMLREFKPKADLILANEIPVGNSASILQAMNPNKSLTRALELYMEVVHPNKTNSKGSKQASAGSSSAAAAAAAAAKKSYLVGKKPVIVVPKGMTAPITLVNAYDFVCNGQFVPRDVVVMGGGRGQQRAAPQTTFTRTVRNSGMLEYEIIDNPKKLGPDLKEWERIVAVIVLGQSWQFKDWPPPYNDAVQLFSRTFGYYIGMEGNKVPAEVSGWAVSQAQLNRDKHGMDKVTHANFWNKLDEWMMVNKRELLPQQDS